MKNMIKKIVAHASATVGLLQDITLEEGYSYNQAVAAGIVRRYLKALIAGELSRKKCISFMWEELSEDLPTRNGAEEVCTYILYPLLGRTLGEGVLPKGELPHGRVTVREFVENGMTSYEVDAGDWSSLGGGSLLGYDAKHAVLCTLLGVNYQEYQTVCQRTPSWSTVGRLVKAVGGSVVREGDTTVYAI